MPGPALFARLGAIALSLLLALPAVAQPAKPVTVEATGRGGNAREARQDAIVAALRQIVGEYIEADVQLADEEVVRNEILSFSNAAGVQSEQVGEPRLVGDEVEVTMRVTAEPRPLVERVKGAAKAGARLDGAALAAELAAAKDDFAAKKRVLEKLFENLPEAFMTIRIVDSEGKDTTGIDRKLVEIDRQSGEATIKIPVVLGFDLAAWKNNVYPAIDQVLTAAASRKVEGGQIVDRNETATTYRVPHTGTAMIPSPTIRAWRPPEPDQAVIALLRENLGRGRQLTFDLFEMDTDLVPYVKARTLSNRHVQLSLDYPARALRVRLLDGDGEAVDGADFDLADGDGSSSGAFALATPFANRLASPFVATQGTSQLNIAPLWLPQSGFQREAGIRGAPASLEMVKLVTFKLPTDDLELIERIEVELTGPRGTK